MQKLSVKLSRNIGHCLNSHSIADNVCIKLTIKGYTSTVSYAQCTYVTFIIIIYVCKFGVSYPLPSMSSLQ